MKITKNQLNKIIKECVWEKLNEGDGKITRETFNLEEYCEERDNAEIMLKSISKFFHKYDTGIDKSEIFDPINQIGANFNWVDRIYNRDDWD
jgi:hypothetical protein